MNREIAYEKYQMTIGIECHVQLDTTTKLFSGADNDARDQEPNLMTSPVDFALPGMLPVLNRRAVELAIRAGKALNATIAPISRFDRKHYFYPDLPKGYQISQMYQPIIIGGFVEAPLESGETVKVRLHHAHLEEDAGKLTHQLDSSLIDLNRAGTPLIEIVSEPDIHSAAEAKAYATELHRLMTYAGVTKGDLYHGNMRFDVNISIAPKDSKQLGTRAEVKNLNSFRSVERAAEYEFLRQAELLEKGESITQETRGWNDATGKTSPQRSKEDAQDYRYMPDPDIPPLVLSPEFIDDIQSQVGALPGYFRATWQSLNLDKSVVESLLDVRQHAELITAIQDDYDDDVARRVAHWFASVVRAGEEVSGPVKNLQVESYAELAQLVIAGKLSSTAAKEIFVELTESSETAESIAQKRNLIQVSDESAIQEIVSSVLDDSASQKSIADYLAGQEKALGYLVGQVMKQSAGKANPSIANQLLRERLAARKSSS